MPDLDQRARFVAIDWAKDAHAVAIVDERGTELLAESFPHTEAGLCALTRTLSGACMRRVGIERADGLLVERLLAAGPEVVPVHPNRLSSARERRSATPLLPRIAASGLRTRQSGAAQMRSKQRGWLTRRGSID